MCRGLVFVIERRTLSKLMTKKLCLICRGDNHVIRAKTEGRKRRFIPLEDTIANPPEIFGTEPLSRYGLASMLGVAFFGVKNDLPALPTSGFERGKIFGRPISVVAMEEEIALANGRSTFCREPWLGVRLLLEGARRNVNCHACPDPFSNFLCSLTNIFAEDVVPRNLR